MFDIAHVFFLFVLALFSYFTFFLSLFLLSRKLDYLDFVSLDSCRNMSLMMLERGWWRFDETSLWSSNLLLKMSPKLVGFIKAFSCNTFGSMSESMTAKMQKLWFWSLWIPYPIYRPAIKVNDRLGLKFKFTSSSELPLEDELVGFLKAVSCNILDSKYVVSKVWVWSLGFHVLKIFEEED